MKKLLFIFLIIASFFNAQGQQVSNYLITRMTEKGMLYHILPQTLLNSNGTKFNFDQTILQFNDTIRIGATLTTKSIFKVDSISFNIGEWTYNSKVTPAFIEMNKKNWDCRIFVEITKDSVKKIQGDDIPTICFYYKDTMICPEIKKSNWQKIKKLNEAIYQQIFLIE